jgi:hypothetical protein
VFVCIDFIVPIREIAISFVIANVAMSAMRADTFSTFTALVALGTGAALVAATAVVASSSFLSAAKAHSVIFEHGSFPKPCSRTGAEV